MVEKDESPKETVLREVKEELGLEIDAGSLKLMCVEYIAAGEEITEALMFVFSGGVLSDDQTARIRIDGAEIESVKFVSSEKLTELLGVGLGARVTRCLEEESCFYFEGKY